MEVLGPKLTAAVCDPRNRAFWDWLLGQASFPEGKIIIEDGVCRFEAVAADGEGSRG